MRNVQIQIDRMSFSYEAEGDVLSEITLQIERNTSVGIIGANGVGKSTLLKLMVGLESGYTGSLTVEELPVIKENYADIRRRIGYVFQDSDSQLFMTTVFEDVAFGPRNYGFSEKEVHQRVAQALEMVGATSLKEKQIYKLSGGEKKLVSIATIVAMTPDIILLDEPSIALDPRNRRRLIEILNSFSQTKLITSHDLDLIWDTCERTILLSDGRIVCEGETKEILRNKILLEDNGLELPLRLQGEL